MRDAPEGALLCGRGAANLAWAELSRAERHAILNFADYLRGVGRRCPDCLHKAEKHGHRRERGCKAKECPCSLLLHEVFIFRKSVKAPGWEEDKT